MREVDVEDRDRDQEHDESAHQAVADREQADPHQVRDAPHRRHERVLDGALPPLPRDRERGFNEDKRQVAPKRRSDEQVKLRPTQVEAGVACSERVETRGEKADRQHADDAVEEPDDFPDPVALVDVELPLGEAEQRPHLRAPHPNHASTSSSSSASSFLPVSCMKTSSSVPEPWRSQSSMGVPSASTRPPSSMSTRS